MVTAADNERLVRVGAGTPMGNLFRRYWQPALLSRELEERDGAPARVRLLGEDLIAFRGSNGTVGLVDAYCPHRRAPLFFARNEECGLRCVYHGWKFDIEGACVDMPSEPADSTIKGKVRLAAYPTVERGGVIWTYMGPADKCPPPPNFEWVRAPTTHRFVSKTFEHCNYLQALEGGLDTAHSSFAHNNNIGSKEPRLLDRSPKIDLERSDYGYCYVSTRSNSAEHDYVRVYHFIAPSQAIRGGVTELNGKRRAVPELSGHIWVPVDDEHTFVYNWACGYDHAAVLTPEHMEHRESFAGRGPTDLVPGTFRLKKRLANDFMIDRALQKTRTFTGIVGVNTQDFAVQEGMGSIVDRSKEFLGTSDKAIVAMRRILLDAMRDVEQGRDPVGINSTQAATIRPYDALVARGADWRVALADELTAKW